MSEVATITRRRANWRGASDPTKDARIGAIFRKFAERCGWPETAVYDEGLDAFSSLNAVANTFIAERVEIDCPTEYPPERAAYDLLPMLLRGGHRGRFLVFGYGRPWYVIADSVAEARRLLPKTYQWQLSHPQWTKIEEFSMRTISAREYYNWKAMDDMRPKVQRVNNIMSEWFREGVPNPAH